jgi:lipid-A-disaccharide synthase
MTKETSLPFRLPAPVSGQVDVLVIAGEHSGDQHAAKMVRGLRARHPEVVVAALGGPALAGAGAQLLHDMTTTSAIGVEVLKHLSFFRALFAEILRWIEEYRPRAVCFVDSSGLNLRLAKAMVERRLSVKGGGSIRTLYYISPQIWASRASRRFKMARHLDGLAVIFPFERESYADTSLPVAFVGHPFLAEDYAVPVSYDPAGPVLLLPGSRKQPVSKIFPVMLASHARFGDREAVVLYPSEKILTTLQAARPPANVTLRPTGEPIAASAVLTSSGTMSMLCALAGIPGAIVYRTTSIEYWLGRLLVKVPYLGIANLLLKEPMYPEYIQNAATPEALARELRECVHNPERRRKTAAQAEQLRAILKQPASGTAADWLWRGMELKESGVRR